MIGFPASGWWRLAIAGGFCLLAVGLVWWAERPRQATPSASPVVATVPGATVRLAVESTYPVARWTVRVLGAEQPPAHADAYSWQGVVALPPGEEVLVIGHADAATTAPHRGLRVRLGDAPERLVWGTGDVAVTAGLP